MFILNKDKSINNKTINENNDVINNKNNKPNNIPRPMRKCASAIFNNKNTDNNSNINIPKDNHVKQINLINNYNRKKANCFMKN
jgi:hypothetical protein